MTDANNLDPDEAPQNVGLHLRSKLFDIQIIYQQNKMGGNNDFFKKIERNKYFKKLPSMQRVNVSPQRAAVNSVLYFSGLFRFAMLDVMTLGRSFTVSIIL